MHSKIKEKWSNDEKKSWKVECADSIFFSFLIRKGAIHKRRRQFGGGRGGRIDDMGRYEGGRCQRKSDIVNSKLADYNFFFFLKMQFSLILMSWNWIYEYPQT